MMKKKKEAEESKERKKEVEVQTSERRWKKGKQGMLVEKMPGKKKRKADWDT
jgi:hypothetical protein